MKQFSIKPRTTKALFAKLASTIKTYCTVAIICLSLSGCNVANILKMRYANDDLQANWPKEQQQILLTPLFEGNKSFIYATVNGVENFRFMLDTGASMTYLFDTPKARKLNLTKGYTIKMGGWGEENDSEVYQTKLQSLHLEGVKFNDVNIAYLPTSKTRYFARPDQATFDGVIGHDIMRHFSWIFDKQTNQISISRVPYQTNGLENSVPFETFFKKISIEADIDFGNGQRAKQELLIDTGSRHYMKMSASYVANNVELSGKTITSADFGLSGKVIHQRTTIPSMTIGNQQFNKVRANLIGIDDDEDENWIVGNALLNQFVTIIDYHTSTLHILPNEQRPFKSRYNLLGLELRKLTTGEFIVRYVSPNMASASKDIQEGDLIMSINDKDSPDLSLDDWLTISNIIGTHTLCRMRNTLRCFDVESKHIKGYSD